MRLLCGLVAMLTATAPALAQRVQFPSTLPPATTTPPSSAPTVLGSGPTATFNGTIQTPPPQWDPYAAPGAATQPLLPNDPTLQYGTPGMSSQFTRMQKLIQNVRLDYVWIPGNGAEELGMNDAELSTTVALPFFHNTSHPLLITPGFAIHLWNGPQHPDMPPRLYDAYLDLAWNPQITPWFGGELSFRTGVYSDMQQVTERSLRFMGKGMAVMTFSPSVSVKAGVWYLDRNKIKLLPAGGIVWVPNSNVRFDILFPDPKIAFRLANYGTTEWWLYARGEYGGGAWTVKQTEGVDFVDRVDYNDIRVGVGLEWKNQRLFSGLFEVGIAFQREVISLGNPPAVPPDTFEPNPSVYVRGGLVW